MDPSCLQYCMTEAQRDHFEQQGYLIVEDALDDDMLDRLLEAGDRVDAEERAARDLAPNALLSKFRTIVEDEGGACFSRTARLAQDVPADLGYSRLERPALHLAFDLLPARIQE